MECEQSHSPEQCVSRALEHFGSYVSIHVDAAAYPPVAVSSYPLSWKFAQSFAKRRTPIVYPDLDSEYLLAFQDDSGNVQVQPLQDVTEEKLALEEARDYLPKYVQRYQAEPSRR
jgi:hypothetical protein